MADQLAKTQSERLHESIMRAVDERTARESIPWTPTGCGSPPKKSRVVWFGEHGEQITGQYTAAGLWLADANHNVPSHEIDYVPSHWRIME